MIYLKKTDNLKNVVYVRFENMCVCVVVNLNCVFRVFLLFGFLAHNL